MSDLGPTRVRRRSVGPGSDSGPAPKCRRRSVGAGHRVALKNGAISKPYVMDYTDNTPLLPVITRCTEDRFGALLSDWPHIRPTPSAPWVTNRDVLKAWYHAANEFRMPPCDDHTTHKPIFRELSKSAPYIQSPMVPALLDYSKLQFEDFTECRVVTHLGPWGNATGTGVSYTMFLFTDEWARRFGGLAYWGSTVDSSFTAYIALHIHRGNILPTGLDNSLKMLECAGMDVFPKKPAVCPPKLMWAKVRWAVAVRPWIKAWLQEYAEKQGGPGGKFFKQGLEGFSTDFCS